MMGGIKCLVASNSLVKCNLWKKGTIGSKSVSEIHSTKHTSQTVTFFCLFFNVVKHLGDYHALEIL